MTKIRAIKINLPRKATIGTMAEPIGQYLSTVAELMASVYVDQSVPKKDKKWLQEQVVHLIAVLELLSMITAIHNIGGMAKWKKIRKLTKKK